jgi:hypothetical protein
VNHNRFLGFAVLCVLGACSTEPAAPGADDQPQVPARLTAPAAQGELWACKFSVDPVTKLPNGDVTSGAITATITSGDGTLEAGVSGGNSTTIGYNSAAPQCVKVWSGGTAATVAVTEDPEAGSAAYFYRFARRLPGDASDDVYFESPVLNPPSEGPVTATIEVTSGAAYEIWFKNVRAETPPPPDHGCTYTQGFWKTHSDRGPAPYSDGWQALGAAEEDTPFFNSGASWYSTFWTPPRGNAFYNLAHQYMAAKLNVLNGSSSTLDVDAALSGAEALFGGLAAGSTTLTSSQRTDALAWASTLDSYNNGAIGPGHCD